MNGILCPEVSRKKLFLACVWFILLTCMSICFCSGVCISIAGQRKIVRLVKEMIPKLVQTQRA